MEKKNIKAEIILIGILVLIGIVMGISLLLTRQPGAVVEVRVSGRTVETFSLVDDLRYEIHGVDGRNLLVIKDGEAWIEDADCPDALCRGMGKISLAGQSVVCLPHEVVVEIIGESIQTDEIDFVAG